MANIGKERREIEVTPIPIPAPVPAPAETPAPAEPAREPEKVPA